MHVAFLVPGIHDRPTGGNIYNRRLADALRRCASATMVPWPERDPPPSLPDHDVLLVDSLLARRADTRKAVRSTPRTTRTLLLAHYLHCLDPTARDAPAAATERAALNVFDGAVTTSRYAKRTLRDQGIEPDRLVVAPPGLNDAYRAPVPAPSNDGPPRLLTVASLLPGKGLPLIVDVLGTMTDLDWRWRLVGDDTLDPAYASSIRRRLQNSPIHDRTALRGPVAPDEMRSEYDRSDVFVLPSQFETCSMSTREAMARGCPVAAFAVGGLPENLGEAPAGHLVPPGDADALAAALRALLTNSSARAQMGRAARKRSRAFPTWPKTAARLHDALRRIQSLP